MRAKFESANEIWTAPNMQMQLGSTSAQLQPSSNALQLALRDHNIIDKLRKSTYIAYVHCILQLMFVSIAMLFTYIGR